VTAYYGKRDPTSSPPLIALAVASPAPVPFFGNRETDERAIFLIQKGLEQEDRGLKEGGMPYDSS
jgi:hypothetical protein